MPQNLHITLSSSHPGMKQVGILRLQVVQLLVGRKPRDGGRGRVSALVKGDVSGVMTKGNAEHETCYNRQHRNRVHSNQSSSKTTAKDFLIYKVIISSDLVSLVLKALQRVDLHSSKQMKSPGI